MKATPWILAALLTAAPPIAAPARAQSPARPGDEPAIRSAVAGFVDAFGKGDAKAIAAMFTEQGEAIDLAGEAIRGRAALEEHYAGRFAESPGEKLETTIELIHFLTPEVARQDGRSRLIPAGDGPVSTSRYAATLAKGGDGRWLFASIRELEDPAITPHERLKELEWMVGDWVEETGDARIATAIAWSEDRNFLLRHYEIHVQGRPDHKGTQRIGWDPIARQIRSWVFDSRGGFGEGHWSRSGDRWVIKSTGVQPDGVATSATQTMARLGKDRLQWVSTDRTLGGETRDDPHEVVMVRKPPEPTR